MSEEDIGSTGSKDDGITIKSAQYSRFHCSNCNRRKVHCIAGGKKGDPVELLKDRCTNDECECRCRTHYLADNGKLKRYGTVDNTSALEGMIDLEVDSDIDEINKKWRKFQESNIVKVKKTK